MHREFLIKKLGVSVILVHVVSVLPFQKVSQMVLVARRNTNLAVPSKFRPIF
jgi:hypothetical protein